MDSFSITTQSHVDGNGMLNLKLNVPTNLPESDVEVVLTVRPVKDRGRADASEESWRRFVEETAGSIDDPSFFRHDQGTFETRDSLE